MKKKTNSKLVDIYHRILELAESKLDQFEHVTVPDALENAKQTVIQLEEATVEDAENIVMFISRDLEDAAQHVHETGENIKFWLGFDVDYVEQHLWQAFSRVADRTVVDRLKLNMRLQRGPVYHTGEITSFGTLQCDACGELLHFHRVSPIPPCPKCHTVNFSRIRNGI